MTDLLGLMQAFGPLFGDSAATWAIIFLRVGAAAAVLPGLGEQIVPMRFRLVIAIVISATLLPNVVPQSLDFSTLFTEVAIGLFLGLSLRFLVFAISTAGTIIANATSLSQIFPQAGEAQPSIATLLTLAAIAGAFEAGLATQTVVFFLISLEAFPIGQLPSTADMANWFALHADKMFALAFTLSLPFIIASVLYNLALGIINKAMPALMVTFIGAPALSLGALALLAVTLPFLLQVWLSAMQEFLSNPFHSG